MQNSKCRIVVSPAATIWKRLRYGCRERSYAFRAWWDTGAGMAERINPFPTGLGGMRLCVPRPMAGFFDKMKKVACYAFENVVY